MTTEQTTAYHFSPLLRVTMNYTAEVDKIRKVKTKDGKTKTIGNDKYKLRGFFDPDTEAGKNFLAEASKALLAFGVTDKDARKAALRRSFKLRSEDKTAPEAIPATWRRLTAGTQYGPVEVLDQQSGEEVPPARFYPGCWAMTQVSFYVYEDERTGEPGVSCRLGPVLKTKDDTRLGGGGRPAARSIFAGHLGSITNKNPFGNEDGDEDDDTI